MPAIFRYFWFIVAGLMAINVLVTRRRLLVAVDRGRATRAEVKAFVSWLGIWFVGGGVAAGIAGLAAGWTSPFCFAVAPAGSVPHLLISLGEIAAWVMLLLWVWRGNGADVLARAAPALERRADYEQTYRPRSRRTLFDRMGSPPPTIDSGRRYRCRSGRASRPRRASSRRGTASAGRGSIGVCSTLNDAGSYLRLPFPLS